METFFVCILKSSLVLASLALFYRLLLRRDTFFSLNRGVLLSLFIASVFIPFMKWEISLFETEAIDSTSVLLLEPIAVAVSSDLALSSLWNKFNNALPLLYFLGLFVFVIRLLFGYLQLKKIVHRSSFAGKYQGTKIYLHNLPIAPFNFYEYIVLSKADYESNRNLILSHEYGHYYYNHSLDRLVAELFCILFWFNPIAWWINKELRLIHEYQADQYVLRIGHDAENYQILLIKKAAGSRLYSIANSFNHSLTKKRITMMLQKKSSPWAKAKVSLVLPFVLSPVMLMGNSKVSNFFDRFAEVKITQSVAEEQTELPTKTSETIHSSTNYVQQDEAIFTVVEYMPRYPGGRSELMKYLGSNMEYPKEAVEKGISGTVIIAFVVEKDGSITNIKILRSVDPLIDAEAIRIVESMPKWTPGKQKGQNVRVKYTLPLIFDLSKATE